MAVAGPAASCCTVLPCGTSLYPCLFSPLQSIDNTTLHRLDLLSSALHGLQASACPAPHLGAGLGSDLYRDTWVWHLLHLFNFLHLSHTPFTLISYFSHASHSYHISPTPVSSLTPFPKSFHIGHISPTPLAPLKPSPTPLASLEHLTLTYPTSLSNHLFHS